MSDTATLEVLIQIREELAGLNRTRAGLQGAKKDAESFGSVIRQGLGIGSGMEIARRGIDLLRNSISETVGAAFRLAGEVKDGAEGLQMSGEAYQVIKFELKEASVEMARFAMATATQTQSLAEARAGAGAASDAYKTLRLSAATLEQMTPEQRAIAVARAVNEATDQTAAFQAAGVILGSRGLPTLLNGLKRLATDGYDKVSASLRSMNQIMDDDTTARLDRAQKNIEKLKNSAVITTGEIIGAADQVRQSAKKDFWGTLWSGLRTAAGPMGIAAFGATVAVNQPFTPAAAPKPPTAPANARTEEVLNVRIANAEAKASAIQSASLLTETEKRRALLPVLDEQARLYDALLKSKYGDLGKDLPANGQVTDAELARYKERNELEWKLVGIRQERMSLVDTPLAALWREMNDTTTMVQNSLAGGIRAGIAGIGSDIWEAAKGTQEWSDAWKNLGNIAGRMLTQMITQMLVVAAINQMLGFFGYGLGGNTGPAIVKLGEAIPVKAAGGGTFITHGPTHFTVGDNPGGVEAVSVVPLSGVGRSTINGRAIAMAGGGSALVSGGRSAASAEGITITLTNHFGAGVSRSEFLSAMPMLVNATKSAVLEAVRRRRDGY